MKVLIGSLSKSLGMFYYRQGFCFSRFEIPSLYGTIWFKNLFSLRIADECFARFPIDLFYQHYQSMQKRAVELLKAEFPDLIIDSSHVMLLATGNRRGTMSKESLEASNPYLRDGIYRFCLQPYFVAIEQE